MAVHGASLARDPPWEYHMRRNMQAVASWLFVGPYAAANRSQLEALKAAGITHIVCICDQYESVFIRPQFPEHFQYLQVNLADHSQSNLLEHFEQVRVFLNACLASNGKVLVHSNVGLSRAPAMVVAYLICHLQTNLTQALELVASRRCCVFIPAHFHRQLQDSEDRLRSLDGRPAKRRHDDS
eukprot:m.104308 g.104308  ORF g.104308 m.104308 type:complete len:183 (+) comp14171_c0_seq4:27-575(+)